MKYLIESFIYLFISFAYTCVIVFSCTRHNPFHRQGDICSEGRSRKLYLSNSVGINTGVEEAVSREKCSSLLRGTCSPNPAVFRP